MDERDRPRGRSPKAGTALIWVGVLGGFIVGVAISAGAGGAVLFKIGTGAVAPSVLLGVTPFIIILVLGCLLV
jgi:energy-coupling factor transport system substrate-specific component